MVRIFRRIRAWLPLFKLGNTVSRRNELEAYSRYLVLNSLEEAGILEFLRKPRKLMDLVKEFDWKYPSKYLDDFMRYLVADKVFIKKGQYYQLNSGVDLSKPDVRYIEDFNDVFEEYAPAIPKRLQGKYFEYTGQLALFSWDSALASQIYQSVRDSALNFVNLKQLKNIHLLDVGCGPGYETADLWLALKDRNNQITALDYDEKLLKIAEEEFCLNINKKGYKEVNWDELKNPPTFIHGSADNMDMFEDNSFDVIYFSNFLHWLNEPLKGIKEMYRVLKPGGMIFGSQGTTDVTNDYLDITSRVMKGVYGYFSKKAFKQWFHEAGFRNLKSATMINTFQAFKPKK